MFGDSIVICVFWGEGGTREEASGVSFIKNYIKNVYLKGGEILTAKSDQISYVCSNGSRNVRLHQASYGSRYAGTVQRSES